MSGELCQCLLNNKDVTRKADTPKIVKTTTIGEIHVTFLEKYPRTDSEAVYFKHAVVQLFFVSSWCSSLIRVFFHDDTLH